jgi:hypothetical protein
MDSDIQSNYSLQLEDYPFLKVFSRDPELDIFSDVSGRFTELSRLAGLLFRINFEGTKAVSVSPYMLITPFPQYKPNDTDEGRIVKTRELYTKHKAIIEKYIRYQLINSGILDVLSDVPTTEGITLPHYDRTPDYKWIASKPFNSCICVTFNISKKSLLVTNFHNDSTLFQILQYSRPTKPYVMGSELLFYHENNDSIIHRSLNKTGDTPVFPVATMGPLIHDSYEKVKEIYTVLKGEARIPLFRHKLKNGDTMVFPDTLWKHAVINPKEEKEDNILKIKVATTNRSRNNDVSVQVCSKRINTEQTEYEGRSIIGLFCFRNMHIYMNPDYFGEPFLLSEAPVAVPVINLDKGACISFLTNIAEGNGCINIGGVNIKHRGGARRNTKTKKKKSGPRKLRKKRKTR